VKGKFRALLGKRFALIASLPANDPALAVAAWDGGADAVKIHINVKHRAGGLQFGSFEEERPRLERILTEARGPVGIMLGADPAAAARDLDMVVAAGFDFVSIYGHHAPVRLLEAGITRMLAADGSYPPDMLRALASLGDIFEASIVPAEQYGEPLTLRDLAVYRAISAALDIPVVVPTQKKILSGEAARLYDAGVSAIMIGAVSAGKTCEEFGRAVGEFRKAMDACARR
jgi:hypothetical protein